jgi:hypothetical protein
MPSSSNPLLDLSMIEAERGRLPARVFAQEYLARFTEGAGAVFRNVRECAVGKLEGAIAGARYYAGLDLAKVEDFTVFTVIDKRGAVKFIDRFHRMDWAVQIARVQGWARHYNNACTLCDTTGVGDPIYEALDRAGLDIEPYPFTAQSKSQLIENLVMMLEQRQLELPRVEVFPELIEELEAFEYSVSEQGHTRTSAPSGQHDDCVMSLALAAWQVRPALEGWSVLRWLA